MDLCGTELFNIEKEMKNCIDPIVKHIEKTKIKKKRPGMAHV